MHILRSALFQLYGMAVLTDGRGKDNPPQGELAVVSPVIEMILTPSVIDWISCMLEVDVAQPPSCLEDRGDGHVSPAKGGGAVDTGWRYTFVPMYPRVNVETEIMYLYNLWLNCCLFHVWPESLTVD